MKRRENKRRTSADLLVCFPSRAHLTLTRPKSIYSPNQQKPINYHRRSNSRGGGAPTVWAKSKELMEIEEPRSPKVTCAGQIRSVKPNPNNWQVMMEEIERIHTRKQKKTKKGSWSESLGFKKDVFQFLTCLRNLRFEYFQCFRAFPSTDLTTTDDEEEEEDDFDQTRQMGIDQDDKCGSSRSEFSESVSSVPPQNALFLMRCRSAPAKTWLEEKEEEEKEGRNEMVKNETSNILEITKNDENFYKLSSDIAKETWVVGGTSDLLLRSRSCKR